MNNTSMVSMESSTHSLLNVEDNIRKQVYNKRNIKLKDIYSFNNDFWLICALSFIERMIIQPFIQNSSELF